MSQGVDLVCDIVATAVAASKAAASQVRRLKSRKSNNGGDTVELKSLKTIVYYFLTNFQNINCENIRSKEKVCQLVFKTIF